MRNLLASFLVAMTCGVAATQGQDIELRTIALISPSSGDRLTPLPASLTTVGVGSTYYLEVWASDVGSLNTGVSSAYIDLAWPAALASAQPPINHGSIFTVFTTGTILAGGVDELGGSAFEVAGVEPEWARVAVVPIVANAAGVVAYNLSQSATGVGARNRGMIPWTDIHLHGVEVSQCQGPPQILQQPADQSVCADAPARFTVAADSVFALRYQWRKDGTPLSDDPPFSGTETAELDISPAVAGAYDVVVTDACDAIISEVAALTFLNCDDGNPLTVDTCANNECIHRSVDFSGNGQVDKADVAVFRAAFGSSTGDSAYNPNVDLDGNGVIDCSDWNLFIAHWPANRPRPSYIPCKDVATPGRTEMPEALCGAVGPAFAAGLSLMLVFFGTARHRRSKGGG